MLAFILIFIVFYTVVCANFSTAVKPVFSKLQTNQISVPSKLIQHWLIVSSSIISLNAVLKARKSDFEMEDSLSLCALVLGLMVGFAADISM